MATVHIQNNTKENIYIQLIDSTRLRIIDVLEDLIVEGSSITADNLGAALLEQAIEFGVELFYPESDGLLKIHRNRSMGDLYAILHKIMPAVDGVFEEPPNTNTIGDLARATFQKNAIKIPPGEYKNVSEHAALGYLRPQFAIGLLGLSNINIAVMYEDTSSFVSFESNHDYSWIATSSRVVRAKYGTINEEDPNSGQYVLVPPPHGVGNNLGDTLGSGQSIVANDYLQSPDQQYNLIMEENGNLVLYEKGNGIWKKGENGTNVTSTIMQEDGNFVMYGDPNRKVYFSTNTSDYPGSYLSLQNDGNLVVYTNDNPRKAPWGRGI